MNRRRLCAEEMVATPRAEKKPKKRLKSRKDTAVAISIKANHYVCGLQPIGSQLYDTRKVTLQYLTISGSQKSILKERPLELPILCVFSIKDCLQTHVRK